MPSSTVENYLKHILLLSDGSEDLVSMGELALALSVVPGTATTMIKALAREGYVAHQPRQGVCLTPAGRTVALSVLRKHRLVETFLVNVLKMDWASVHAEAEQLEHAISDEVLDRLGLTGLGARHIRELSGGQQQRVFLARALVQQPDLLVLDEPTAGIDVRTRHEVLHVLADLNEAPPQGQGIAIVLTTHDLNGLAAHLPRLVCFNRTVVADGSPHEVLTPEVLERTYGAPMEVLAHGGLPVVLEHGDELLRTRLRRLSA
jgi:Mn-dependent DtxR family transcriptional regulator